MYFKTEELQKVLAEFENFTFISDNKLAVNFEFKGSHYQCGFGGIHSVDSPAIFIANDEYEYIDFDIASFYPVLAIVNKIEPKHLMGLFTPIYRLMTDTRLKAKGEAKNNNLNIEERTKNKKLANILKIVINSSFGMMNDIYSFLYDPKALYSITMNGQLILLALVEAVSEIEGCDVISANTDGFVTKVSKKVKDQYMQTCLDTSKYFDLDGEFTHYSKYVRTSVNSYITIKTDGTTKVKGEFEHNKVALHDGYSKGFSQPIVAYALMKYYTEDIPVETTVKEHKDIYDFCLSSNIGNQYKLQHIQIINGKINKTFIQKHVRYYISKNGGSLLKVNISGGRDSKMSKGFNITVFNDYHNVDDFEDYNINYNYYIKECYKLINDIERKSTKSIKKHGGTLFD